MTPPRRPLRRSLSMYAHGIAGGLLFSLPFLYTMEVWWTGLTVPPGRAIAWMIGTFSLLLGFNYYAGLRKGEGWGGVLVETVEALGLGVALAALVLWLFQRLPAEQTAPTILGQIVMEGFLVAIGVSVGAVQLGASEEDEEEDAEDPASTLRSHLVVGTCGAIMVASTVAPTEEILIMAVEMRPLQLAIALALSLALCGVTLFAINLREAKRTGEVPGPAGALTCAAWLAATWLAALVSSAFLLWSFGRLDGMSIYASLAQVVVLGFPSSLGAAAGRLLLQW